MNPVFIGKGLRSCSQFRTSILVTLFVLLCLSVLVPAQPTSSEQPAVIDLKPIEYFRISKAAKQYFRDKNFKMSEELLERLVQTNSSDGNIWSFLASSRYELKHFREAIPAYEKAAELGFLNAGEAAYQIARCYSFLSEPESALEWLKKALHSRYRNRIRIIRDDAFKSLRDDARFLQLAGSPKDKNTGRIRGWTTDLDYLISEIQRVHYSFSREPLPRNFLLEAAEIRRDLKHLSDTEVIVRFQRLITLLGDGHSLIYPFGMRLGSLKRLPLTFYLFSDGLFVIDAADPLKDMIGKKVLSLGGLSTEKVIKGLEQLVSRDNPMGLKWAGVFYLTLPDFLKELGVATNRDQVSFLFEDTGKQQKKSITVSATKLDPDAINIKLIPVKITTFAPVPLYLSQLTSNYWFQKLDQETVYFQFNQVQDQANETLAAFSLRLRKFLDENNIKNLIIDVRLNNGGEATLLNELYRTLVHFETTRERASIYVLIGRDTFSAAQTFVSSINYLTGAIYVGEPSGSKPNRVGDEARFKLPFSGVLGSIASGYNQAANKDNRIWIAPDIPVELSSKDYFGNHDPVLETVLEIIKNSPESNR